MTESKKCIALAGASGTGKTTLAQWLSETYQIPINPVGSRSVAKAMGFDNPYDVDKAGKRAEFQQRLLAEKREWESANDQFVSDRTTLDNLTYTLLHDVHAVSQDFMDSAVEGLTRYSLIVFCPVNVFCNLEDDPNRVKVPTYHLLYNDILRMLLQKHVTSSQHLGILRRRSLVDRQKWFQEKIHSKY